MLHYQSIRRYVLNDIFNSREDKGKNESICELFTTVSSDPRK